MANILTAAEAANVLRCLVTDPLMLDLLPAVDQYVETASGRDWTGDSPVHPLAKSAGRMLLVKWHEDPGGLSAGEALSFGLQAALAQLRAEALRYRTFAGISGSGYAPLPGVKIGDTVISVTGRVGASGNQSAAFEAVITLDDAIYQISGSNLTLKWYTAYIVPPEAV